MEIITLSGGLVLFLYGFKHAKEGLDGLATNKLNNIISRLINKPVTGCLFVILFTFVLQSSSAMSVILIGLVNSGIINLYQSIGVILGAGIGTSITVQIISTELHSFVYLPLIIGFITRVVSSKRSFRFTGDILMGFGLVFIGMKIMSGAFPSLKEGNSGWVLFSYFRNNYLFLFLISLAITILIQASAATIGIAVVLSKSINLDPPSAFAIVLGANAGTPVTAAIASIIAPGEGKKVAISYIILKFIGVFIFFLLLKPFSEFVFSLTPDNFTRFIANVHTFFNVILAILLLPFAGMLSNIINRMIKVKEKGGEFYLKYIDTFYDSPSIAIAQATREILRMCDKVEEMLKLCLQPFRNNSYELAEEIKKKDDYVDFLDSQIRFYLVKVLQKPLSEDMAGKISGLIYITSNLENIGDVIDLNLMELAKKKIQKGLEFSIDGFVEIEEFHKRIMDEFHLLTSAISINDTSIAEDIIRRKRDFSAISDELLSKHIERIKKGLKESIETSSIHIDTISNLRRIITYITNSAYPIIKKR